MPSYLWPMTSPCPVLVGYRLVRFGPCACLSFMNVQNLPTARVYRVWPAQYAVCSWPFFGFPFLYDLPYLGLGLVWWWALFFLQPTFFLLPSPTIPLYHSYCEIVLPQSGCLFGPAVHSSPNGPARPLVLLSHQWRAPVSHLFSLGRLGPVCFPWTSSALFLTLHYHGLLLNSLGFPSPITLFLIFGVHGLAIDPLLSLLLLL